MKTAIVTMIKNEHLYLDEWIEYHLNLGIDYIFIYEDLDSKSHIEITYEYPTVFLHNIIELYEGKQIYRHDVLRDLANYFALNYCEDFDWIAFIDVDEYITCRAGKTLKLLLSQYNLSVLMLWLNYNANGHFYRPEGKIVDNYTQLCGNLDIDGDKWVYKTFAKMSENPIWKDPHYVDKYEKQNYIYIRHYITKSFEDYCYRIYERGDVYHRKYRDFKLFLEANPEFSEEECRAYVYEKYGNIEEYVLESEYYPEEIKHNQLKRIIFTKVFNLNENSNYIEYVPRINGTFEVIDLHATLGGFSYYNKKLSLFVHKQRQIFDTRIRIIIVDSEGKGEEIIIDLEKAQIASKLLIRLETFNLNLPECSGYCSIGCFAPKSLGKLHFDTGNNYYRFELINHTLFINFYNVPNKYRVKHDVRIYGENGGETFLTIWRN